MHDRARPDVLQQLGGNLQLVPAAPLAGSVRAEQVLSKPDDEWNARS